jgi:putative tricarboxylic transport membrane protein
VTEDPPGHDQQAPLGTLGNATIAVFVIALGVAAVAGSMKLGVGAAREPRAGTWPLLVGGALVVLGIGLLALARRTTDAERFTRGSWLVLAGLASMAGLVAVIEQIGFEIPAALLAAAAREHWGVHGPPPNLISVVVDATTGTFAL